MAACRESGAREVRTAADEAERQLLWKGRKSAFGAYGRISPAYMVMDGVIPRTRLPYVLGRVNEIVAAHGLRVGNVFHAGDGNLHPNILYDPRVPGRGGAGGAGRGCDHEGLRRGRRLDLRRARHRTGEGRLHAVHLLRGRPGVHAARSRSAFNPTGLCNPGKVFPTKKSCGRGRAGRLSTAPDRRAGPRPALLSAGGTSAVGHSPRQAPRRRRRRPRPDGSRSVPLRRRRPHARRRRVPGLVDGGGRRRARGRGVRSAADAVGRRQRRRRRPAPAAGRHRTRPAPARPSPGTRARRPDGHRGSGDDRSPISRPRSGPAVSGSHSILPTPSGRRSGAWWRPMPRARGAISTAPCAISSSDSRSSPPTARSCAAAARS